MYFDPLSLRQPSCSSVNNAPLRVGTLDETELDAETLIRSWEENDSLKSTGHLVIPPAVPLPSI